MSPRRQPDIGILLETEADIRSSILAVPGVASWPDIERIVAQDEDVVHPGWQLPILACRAVGGDQALSIPGAAAIACLEISIILVDDILDDDPRGEYRRIGSGAAANLALAFQAAAFTVIEQAMVTVEQRTVISDNLAQAALTTALAQHWDVQNLSGEDEYWKVVRAKTTPIYSTALYIGALMGGTDPETADGLRHFGVLFAEMSQVRDDLLDAFQTPANPDWQQGRNSLPLLYSRTADHPDRSRFLSLLPRISDPRALVSAQQILIECGAVSYCVYEILQRHQHATEQLTRILLADPDSMLDLLAWQTGSVAELLRTKGLDAKVDWLRE